MVFRAAQRGASQGRHAKHLAVGLFATLTLFAALPAPHASAGPCVAGPAGTITCSGDQSAGIASGTDFPVPATDTLIVNGLTANIAPPAFGRGIHFQSLGSVSLDTAASSFSVITTGNVAIGINLRSDASTLAALNRLAVTTNGSLGHGILAIAEQAVSVDNRASLLMQGSDSSGILTQSLSAGVSVENSAAITLAAPGAPATFLHSAGIQATGATGASIINSGTIETVSSSGLLATTNTGAATISNTGDITITAAGGNDVDAAAIWADSQYFLPGSGDVSVENSGTLSVTTSPLSTFSDGNGISATGNANVTVRNSGAITTAGEDGDGINARSSNAVPGTSVLIENSGPILTSGESAVAIDGDANSAALLTIKNSGALETSGVFALGIDSSTQSGTLTIENSASITTTGQSGFAIVATSDNGEIEITNSALITASGNAALGIGAQTAGNVAITTSQVISTPGTQSAGIIAVSDGSGGTVEVNADATVSASGSGSYGIVAIAEQGTTTINVASGARVIGGSGAGAAVWFGGGTIEFAGTNFTFDAVGSNNTLLNAGEIFAGSGLAVLGDAGNDAVHNDGALDGSIDLRGGTNSIVNRALFDAGPIVNVGAGNTVTNDATMYVRSGVISTTTLTGNFVQSSSGVLVIDVDPLAGQADLLTVSGTATLAGQLRLNQLNAGPVPGTQQITVIEATGGVVNNGIVLANTGAVNYAMIFPNGNDVDVIVEATTDFAPDGMNSNQTALGEHVNTIQLAGGSSAFAPVATALAALPDVPSLAAAYDVLSPELYLKTEIAALFTSLSFADNLMSCRVRDGGQAFIREGQCVWAEATGRFVDQHKAAQSHDFSENAWRFSGGMQVAVAAGTHINFAAGYEKGSLDSHRARADVDRAMAGVAIKHQAGPLMLTAALTGGHAWHDDRRSLAFPGFAALADAEHDVTFVAGRLRAAWQHDMGGWYVKPLADIDLSHIHRQGLREAGGGGAGLEVGSSSTTVVSFSPAIEIGGESRLSDGTLLRPYVSAGLTVFSQTDFALSSRFLSAPDGIGDFAARTSIDRVVADVSAGLALLGSQGISVKIGYDGRLGETVREHSVGAKVSVPF